MIASVREYHAACSGAGATARQRMHPTSAPRRLMSAILIHSPKASGREEIVRLGGGGGIDLLRIEAKQHHARDDLALERRVVQVARDDAASRHRAARRDGEL